MELTSSHQSRFDYAFQETPDDHIRDIIEDIPSRWGRMPPLSRLLVVETGHSLKKNGFLNQGRNLAENGKTAGLIGGTTRGSLTTDLAFAETLKQGPELASPALFGYTLANIPLAEAANHYGLIGPVYAIADEHNPFQKAVDECEKFLQHTKNIDFMLACVFDDLGPESDRQLQITFSIIERT